MLAVGVAALLIGGAGGAGIVAATNGDGHDQGRLARFSEGPGGRGGFGPGGRGLNRGGQNAPGGQQYGQQGGQTGGQNGQQAPPAAPGSTTD
jgi:ATP-dependent RNA helicase DDX21